MQTILYKANDLDLEVSKLQDEKTHLLEENKVAAGHLKKVIKECNRTKAIIGRLSEDSEKLIAHLREKEHELTLATQDVSDLKEELAHTQEMLAQSKLEMMNCEKEHAAELEIKNLELGESKELARYYTQQVEEWSRHSHDKDDRIKALEVEIGSLREGIGLFMDTSSQITPVEQLSAAQFKDEMLELRGNHQRILIDNEGLRSEIESLRELSARLLGQVREAKEIEQQLRSYQERVRELGEEQVAYRKLSLISAERLEGLARENSLLNAEVAQLREEHRMQAPQRDTRTARTQTSPLLTTLGDAFNDDLSYPAGSSSHVDESTNDAIKSKNSLLKQDLDMVKATITGNDIPRSQRGMAQEGPAPLAPAADSARTIRSTFPEDLRSAEKGSQSEAVLHESEELLPVSHGEPFVDESREKMEAAEHGSGGITERVFDTRKGNVAPTPSTVQHGANPPIQPNAAAIDAIGQDLESSIVFGVGTDENHERLSLSSSLGSNQKPSGHCDDLIVLELRSENMRLVSEIRRLHEEREAGRDGLVQQTPATLESFQKHGGTAAFESPVEVESRTRLELSGRAAEDLQQRYKEALNNFEVTRQQLSSALEREESWKKAFAELSSKLNPTFGLHIDSMADAPSVITKVLENKEASLLKLQAELVETQQSIVMQEIDFRKLKEEHESLRQANITLQRLNESLSSKLAAEQKDLEAFKKSSDDLLSANLGISKELEHMRSIHERVVEALADEKREKTKVNKRYTDLLRRDEEKSRKLTAENSELRKSLVEIRREHQSSLIKLSEVESTHASLLRKIIAWGNPGPDEVISVEQKVHSQPIESTGEKSTARLFRAYLHQRWAVFTLRYSFQSTHKQLLY